MSPIMHIKIWKNIQGKYNLIFFFFLRLIDIWFMDKWTLKMEGQW